ncbi:beta-d-glucosyl crocetin beta-1 [Quercus suber]|uniref:Beta-d-glucosyl crocetin beta-1 n=1 Tax=Quercus suber TaxID=58331 RepID=A0AAW0LL34_QUESU
MVEIAHGLELSKVDFIWVVSVLMLPWLAHGHISPFLELAKKLTTRNIHIYFCTTPINLGPIKQQLSKKYSLSIEFVELHLPSLPELPPHYHTTNGLPPHLMPALKKAMDMASPNITSILKQLKPDLVIYDFLQILTPSLAQSQNIPAVEFVVMSATMTSFFMHLANNPGVEYPSPEIYLQDYEVGKFTDDSDDGDRILECFHQSSEIVLVKTFREIEAKYIDYLSVLAKKKIVPVGPLVQDPVEEDEKKEIIEWLNDKEPSSAVFVSFGSEFFLSKEEMQEIAYGLELSMVPFIWVVRFPRGEKVNLQMALPKEVAKVIRKVLVEKTPKRKAKELKENIENKGDEEIDVVVQDLLRLCSKSKE